MSDCIRIAEWTKNTVDNVGMVRPPRSSSSKNSDDTFSIASLLPCFLVRKPAMYITLCLRGSVDSSKDCVSAID